MDDPYVYSIENVLRQTRGAAATLGFYEVRFYVTGTRPSKEKTDTIGTFYYYPSGGTLRDRDMNIIFYEPRLDAYRSILAQRSASGPGAAKD